VRYAFSRASGRDVVWLAVHALPTFFVSILTVALPLAALNALAIPFYWYLAPADDPVGSPYPVTSWELAATMPLIAAVYALLSWFLVPGVARLVTAVSAALLAAPARSRLAERVDALTLSRAAALDAHAAELRRIERDLHDGAQNRLVSVVMMLGIAERALENGGAGAVDQLRRAQDAASDALAGLRRTVHDIYPPILDELGLEGALGSLAGRSAVPCTLDAAEVGRVPAAVESASYFVVAEALTNVNKHSGASSASVILRRDGERVRIVVEDDGHGGAIERPGGGFAGIRRRVEAFEGTMELTSPPGGPTTLRAEMLCGS
jgi:signal transduction histidine kinase